MENLGKNVNVVRHSNAVAAGTSAITPSAGIDMTGYEGALFLFEFGAIVSGAATSIKVAASDDDGSADAYSDLVGTAQTVADDTDNKVFLVDVKLPQKKWLKGLVLRATQNATLEGITVLLYGSRVKPVTQGATVGGSESFTSPEEGTA